jgi:hypothetical protein
MKWRTYSYSLSSKSITDQIADKLDIADMRYNTISMLYPSDDFIRNQIKYQIKADNSVIPYPHGCRKVLLPFDLKDDLVKYEKDSLIESFPHFVDKDTNELYYKTIYTIASDISQLYVCVIDNEKTLCNRILICCDEKNTFNIFFDYDTKSKLYGNQQSNYSELISKEIFENKNI